MIIDQTGVRADPEKLQAINDFPPPRDRRQLQGFLGVCGFSRRFVRSHANYIAPFRDLLKPHTKWSWSEKHDQAFYEIKKNFINSCFISCDTK